MVLLPKHLKSKSVQRFRMRLLPLIWHDLQDCTSAQAVFSIDKNSQNNEIKVHIYSLIQSGKRSLNRKLLKFIIMEVQPFYF